MAKSINSKKKICKDFYLGFLMKIRLTIDKKLTQKMESKTSELKAKGS